MTNSPYRHVNDNKLPTEDEQLLESPPPQRPEQIFLKSDSWRVLRIMGEFVWGFDNLADVSDGVTIFGSARTQSIDPHYVKAVQTAMLLAQAGIVADHRPGHVRLSPYFYNVPDDHRAAIERLTRD